MATVLHVLDMGLDFKSYASFRDGGGNQLMGNQFQYDVACLSATFQPTCGLLTGIIHRYMGCAGTPAGSVWLDQYVQLQQKYLGLHANCKPTQMSIEYILTQQQLVQQQQQAGAPPAALAGHAPRGDKLLMLLDQQSGMSGANSPSARKVMNDPKLALCNLHLADAKCNQEFLCNQLHLCHPTVAHRHDFFTHLATVLKAQGSSDADVVGRVKDAMLFAKLGNRITVAHEGVHYLFFKTTYTRYRVENALQMPFPASVPEAVVRVLVGAAPHKPMHAQNPAQLNAELETAAMQYVAPAEEAKVASPTTRKWNAAIDSFVDHTVVVKPADHLRLMQTLVGTKASGMDNMQSPVTPDHMTPLINQVFDTPLSEDASM
jgi:hypothetical protein